MVGAEFDGIFVDDEEGFSAVFWVKYITRRIFVELFGGFGEGAEAGEVSEIHYFLFMKVK